jgi:hypothetical protein
MKKKTSTLLKFILVMMVFMAGMIMLITHQIASWWIWLVYISLWTIVEMRVAKNLKLGWHIWFFIITGLFAVDAIVIYLIN